MASDDRKVRGSVPPSAVTAGGKVKMVKAFPPGAASCPE
jgi:hypothetical protein